MPSRPRCAKLKQSSTPSSLRARPKRSSARPSRNGARKKSSPKRRRSKPRLKRRPRSRSLPRPGPRLSKGRCTSPTTKPTDKAEKKAKKPPKQVVWRDESVKRRTIKTRGDSSGGLGWRERKTGRQAAPRGRRRANHILRADRAVGARDRRARNDHGCRPRSQDVGEGRGSHQDHDEARHHGDDQSGDRPGHGHDPRRRNGSQGRAREARRSGCIPGRGAGRAAYRVEARAEGAGRDRDGSRRPRQDLAARLRPPHARGERRGGRHHAAHRRVPRRNRARHDHVPRHAGPRGVYRHACARREGDGHRHSGRRGGRRRDAADAGSDRPCEGRQGADRRGAQQDRQA